MSWEEVPSSLGAKEIRCILHILNSPLNTDYIAVLALGTPNIPFVKNRTYKSLGFIEGTLTRLKIPFKEALPNLGFRF